MSEFFLELFSEEIPSNLQKEARKKLLEKFQNFFEKKKIIFSKSTCFSTPNRIIVFFEGIKSDIYEKSEEIKGPRVGVPEKAIEGFLKSNNFEKKNLYQKENEKGLFYFVKKDSKIIKVYDLLNENIPLILDKISWKKSMKWGEFELYWPRPLKSILGIFNKKNLTFNYHHLICSNSTYIDKDFEEKKKFFTNFKSYSSFFKSLKIIIDQNKRKKFIENELLKKIKKKKIIYRKK